LRCCARIGRESCESAGFTTALAVLSVPSGLHEGIGVSESDCLFCRIVDDEIPARFVHRDDRVVAFHDVNPQAPLHLLVVPVKHVTSLRDATAVDGDLLAHIVEVIQSVTRDAQVADSGYRTVVNTGADGGQTVDHLHLHVLGGRRMAWPPG
jgi:histidine triad (HIT) family protein